MKFGCNFSSKAFHKALMIAFAGAVTLAACSPEPVVRTYKEPRRDFGPTRTDGWIDVAEIKMNALPTADSVRWKGDIETAAWYRATEDLGWLARRQKTPRIAHLAYRMREAVGAGAAGLGQTVASSAYASAAVGETREDTAKAVAEGVAMLKAQRPIIDKLLADRSANTKWPTGRASLVSVVSAVDGFLVEFVRDVQRSAVDKAVKKELVTELRINFGPKVQRIRAQVALAYNEPKVYNFVAKVRKVLKEEGLSLGGDIEQRLDLAERLPREVERIVDAKSALSVLVDFWLVSSKQVRETKFKVMAPDLYDFFSGQSSEDLQCIKTGCGFFTRIKRMLFILPEIEKFGVAKIRQILAQAAEEAIKEELEEEAVKFLPTLHTEVAAQIATELDRQRANITKVSTDYGNYLRVVLGRMAVAKLGLKEKDPVAGPDPLRIRVDLTPAKVQAVRVPGPSGEGFQTGAAALGAGMAAALELHDYHVEGQLISRGISAVRARQIQGRMFFEQINNVLMVGGFKTEASKPFESFSLQIAGAGTRRDGASPRFNLRTMIASDGSYAMPDSLTIGRASKPENVVVSTPSKVLSISAAGQAELLRGLSRLAMSLRDWESTTFDNVLGPISVAEFVPDLPREAVDQKLFPKDLFYAAAVGNAGAILQNVTKAASPIALISPNGKMFWANEKDPATDPAEQAIKATVFDFVNGQRSNEAKTIDVARFVTAVADFLRATDGIEKTTASVLIDGGKSGERPLDQIMEARTDLKLLVMALGNFLLSEAIGPDGLVKPLFSRTEENLWKGMSGQPKLVDQAIVIRALLDTSEILSAAIFKTGALDLLAATNATFFRKDLAFYSESPTANEAPNLETLAAVLVAGERLAPHMSFERADQWKRISRPWINALRDAAEALP